MRQFLSLLHRFHRDERGVFAVIFGILAIVLVATAGAVVDYTSVEQARARAQDALDSAALGLQPTIYNEGVTEQTILERAQSLVEERLANDAVAATVENVSVDTVNGVLRLEARITVPTAFVALVGVNQLSSGVIAEARSGAVNLEVALALDVTLSMSSPNPNKIVQLKEAAAALVPLVVQDSQPPDAPTYTKMALVPYSSAVNVGSYANAVRGSIIGATAATITGVEWLTLGSSNVRTITGISKQNPVRITTSGNHGYVTGQTVHISAVAGGSSFTNLNGNSYTITRISDTVFSLNGVNSLSWGGSYTANSGRVTMGSARAIASVSKANPGVVTTGVAHGLSTGDAVYVTSVAGGGFTALNENWYNVTVLNSTQFRLNGRNTSSWNGTYTANSGVMRKCLTNECEVIVTNNAHGFQNNDVVLITGASYLSSVGGNLSLNTNAASGNPLNGRVWRISDRTTNTYVLEDSFGGDMGSFAANAQSWCTTVGCEFYYFQNKALSYSLYRIRTCVTERVGTNQYNDTAPSTTVMGRHYTGASGDCLTPQITPLTSDKPTLEAEITALSTTGSTSGHIGTAWAWYLVSPNFGYLFPNESQRPAEYDAPFTKKIVIIMTDGEYNTPYCNGVIAKDHTSPYGNNVVANCNATNGSSLSQATALCAAMKAAGITIYTVGFELGSSVDVINMLSGCASSPATAYLADGGTELMNAFQAIGNSISNLRLAQ